MKKFATIATSALLAIGGISIAAQPAEAYSTYNITNKSTSATKLLICTGSFSGGVCQGSEYTLAKGQTKRGTAFYCGAGYFVYPYPIDSGHSRAYGQGWHAVHDSHTWFSQRQG